MYGQVLSLPVKKRKEKIKKNREKETQSQI